METKDVMNFIFEMGMLSRVKHEGWRAINVDNPKSVADHTTRAAQIGYLLAKMEGFEHPELVATMLLFHDIGECRIGDLHKIANHYINEKGAEKHAVSDQVAKLGKDGQDILHLWEQIEERKGIAGNIAKDADYLDTAFTAKEFLEIGFTYAQDFINNCAKKIQTKSARQLLEALKDSNSNEWWQGLKKI